MQLHPIMYVADQYAERDFWQFELDEPGHIEAVIGAYRAHDLDHEVVSERGGDRFARRIVRVVSPGGVTVWFEGTNEPPSTEN
jgi:hypothetical protein